MCSYFASAASAPDCSPWYWRPDSSNRPSQRIDALRKLQLQSLDQLQRRVVRIADPKNNFVFRIVLQTMAAKALIHLRIGTLERLQNRNWRRRLCGAGALARRLSLAQKSSRAPQAEHVISQAADCNRPRSSRSNRGNAMNHPGIPSCDLQRPLAGLRLKIIRPPRTLSYTKEVTRSAATQSDRDSRPSTPDKSQTTGLRRRPNPIRMQPRRMTCAPAANSRSRESSR